MPGRRVRTNTTHNAKRRECLQTRPRKTHCEEEKKSFAGTPRERENERERYLAADLLGFLRKALCSQEMTGSQIITVHPIHLDSVKTNIGMSLSTTRLEKRPSDELSCVYHRTRRSTDPSSSCRRYAAGDVLRLYIHTADCQNIILHPRAHTNTTPHRITNKEIMRERSATMKVVSEIRDQEFIDTFAVNCCCTNRRGSQLSGAG